MSATDVKSSAMLPPSHGGLDRSLSGKHFKFEARKSIRFSTPASPATIEKESHQKVNNLVRFFDDTGKTGDDHFLYQYPVSVGGKENRPRNRSSAPQMRASGGLTPLLIRAPSIRLIEKKLAPIVESSAVTEIQKPASGNGITEYVKLISQGTYGIVWEALDQSHGTVAVKIQNPSTREQTNAILQEIDLHEHMCHQNPKVVQLFRKFSLESQHFMVMERMTCSMACVDLPLTEKEVASVLQDTLEALLAIHKEGIAHRDIKPDNLMLSTDGEVKICDFGLSAFDGDVAQLAGTMVYLPPEVCEEFLFRSDNPQLKANFAVDLWALGITISELLTGKVPFEDPDTHTMSEWIYERPAHRLPPIFSKEMQNIVELCLQKEPTDRPTIKSLLEHPLFLDKEIIKLGRESLKEKSDKYKSTVRR